MDVQRDPVACALLHLGQIARAGGARALAEQCFDEKVGLQSVTVQRRDVGATPAIRPGLACATGLAAGVSTGVS